MANRVWRGEVPGAADDNRQEGTTGRAGSSVSEWQGGGRFVGGGCAIAGCGRDSQVHLFNLDRGCRRPKSCLCCMALEQLQETSYLGLTS
jgi:hypothetical protein